LPQTKWKACGALATMARRLEWRENIRRKRAGNWRTRVNDKGYRNCEDFLMTELLADGHQRRIDRISELIASGREKNSVLELRTKKRCRQIKIHRANG